MSTQHFIFALSVLLFYTQMQEPGALNRCCLRSAGSCQIFASLFFSDCYQIAATLDRKEIYLNVKIMLDSNSSCGFLEIRNY